MFSLRRYHGAPVIVRRIFDCARCTTLMLLFDALPYSSEPYVQMGLITEL